MCVSLGTTRGGRSHSVTCHNPSESGREAGAGGAAKDVIRLKTGSVQADRQRGAVQCMIHCNQAQAL